MVASRLESLRLRLHRLIRLVHDRKAVQHAGRLIHHAARPRQMPGRELAAAIGIPQSQQREIVVVEEMNRVNPQFESYSWEGPDVGVSGSVGERSLGGGSFAAVEVFSED